MTIALIVSIFVLAAGFGTAVHPRTRKYFLKEIKQQKALPPHESDELKQWKQVFYETVLSADGSVSPEIEAFLMDHDKRVEELLAGARVAAEKDRAEILEKAQEERAAILKEENEWTTNDRPLLVGSAYVQFKVEKETSKTPEERMAVSERWHNKGFRFPGKLRAQLLSVAANEHTRDVMRKLFDEQDTPTPISKKKSANNS